MKILVRRIVFITLSVVFSGLIQSTWAGEIGGTTVDSNRWEEVSELPIGKEQFAAATLNGKIYAFGGGTNTYAYDGTNWTWVVGADVNSRLGASVLDGKIYAVAGGSGGHTNVLTFDGTTWANVDGLPAAREWLTAGTLDSTLYAVGGGGGGYDQTTNVYAFNGTSWSEVEGLNPVGGTPYGTAELAGGVLDGKLYVMGGVAPGLGSGVTNVQMFDGANWTHVIGLPSARRRHAATAFEDKIYVIGGLDTSGAVVSNVFVFNGTTWSEIAGLPSPRQTLAVAVLDDCLYAMGGDGPKKNVYRYPASSTYSGVAPESGSFTGNFEVVITGSGLCNGTIGDVSSVTLCGVAANVVSVNGTTQIVVTAGVASGSAIGLGDVQVVSIELGESIKTNGFTYNGAPGMRIEGLGGTVVLHSAQPSVTSGTFFTPPLRSGSAQTNTFAFINDGTNDLTITSFLSGGTGAAMFSTQNVFSTVSAGTASNLLVVYEPTGEGNHSLMFSIVNNSATPNFVMYLRGLCYDLAPEAGPLAGGASVTITNGHYGTVTNVTVGGSAATVTASDQNTVTFTTPASGSSGAKDIVIQTTENGDFTLASAFTYHPAGYINRILYDWESWEQVATPLTQYAEFPSMAVYSNALYLMGGNGLSNVYRYASGSWTEVESLPHPVWGATAGSMGGYLYLAGGMNPANSAVTNQMYRFDGTSWTRIADMEYPRGYAAGVVVNDKFHILGGMDESGALPATSVVFDGTNWLSQSFGTVFGVRLGAAAVGTNVYVSGGEYGSPQIFYHRLYITNDLNQMAYGSQTFMPYSRAYHASATLDDKVYIIAGRVGGAATNGVWCYDFTNRLADPPSVPVIFDSLAAATYRKSIYVTGGSTLNHTTNIYRYPAQSGAEGVVPDFGVRNGGYAVTISGSNLGDGTDVTNVTLCGVNVTSIQSQSATQIVVIAGASGSSVTGDVCVYSTSYGVSLLTNGFAYAGTGKDQQTITFAQIANQYTNSTVRLSATASSSLPVSFAVASGPGRITGSTNLTFTGVGEVSITASQAGDDTYDPAPDVTRSFLVLGNATFKLSAVALTNSVVLRWTDPYTIGFSNHTVLVRFDTNDYPATTADGSSIYSGTNVNYTHEDRPLGVTNYYTVFVSQDGSSFTNTP